LEKIKKREKTNKASSRPTIEVLWLEWVKQFGNAKKVLEDGTKKIN